MFLLCLLLGLLGLVLTMDKPDRDSWN